MWGEGGGGGGREKEKEKEKGRGGKINYFNVTIIRKYKTLRLWLYKNFRVIIVIMISFGQFSHSEDVTY